MNLNNTTAKQDTLLESELRALRQLDFDPSVIKSILEDLDDRLTRALREKDESDAQNDEVVRDLQVRISELENDLSEARDALAEHH